MIQTFGCVLVPGFPIIYEVYNKCFKTRVNIPVDIVLRYTVYHINDMILQVKSSLCKKVLDVLISV